MQRLWMAMTLVLVLATQVVAADNTLTEEERNDGWKLLFDGRTLDGWVVAPGAYAVENGTIVCVQGTAGNLLTTEEYGDFTFRFDFKLGPGANNGVGIRCPLVEKGSLHLEGTELQILDDTAEKYATLKPYQYHGSVYGVCPARRGSLKPLGEWNSQEVAVKGRTIRVTLNGELIVDCDLDKATKEGTMDGQEHPGLARTSGHVGFLGHGDRVEFRNIRIRNLAGK